MYKENKNKIRNEAVKGPIKKNDLAPKGSFPIECLSIDQIWRRHFFQLPGARKSINILQQKAKSNKRCKGTNNSVKYDE